MKIYEINPIRNFRLFILKLISKHETTRAKELCVLQIYLSLFKFTQTY